MCDKWYSVNGEESKRRILQMSSMSVLHQPMQMGNWCVRLRAGGGGVMRES